jgi:hypothetical protein
MRVEDDDEDRDVPDGFWSRLLLATPLFTLIGIAVAALFGWI